MLFRPKPHYANRLLVLENGDYIITTSRGEIHHIGDAWQQPVTAALLTDTEPQLAEFWQDGRHTKADYEAPNFPDVGGDLLEGEWLVEMVYTLDRTGAWYLTSRGRVIVRGTAAHRGDLANLPPGYFNAPPPKKPIRRESVVLVPQVVGLGSRDKDGGNRDIGSTRGTGSKAGEAA